MITDFRIAKHKARVTLASTDGTCTTGHLFVQPYARHRPHGEDAVDVLNGDEPFVPLATDDGATVLCAKDSIAEAAVDTHAAVASGDDVGLLVRVRVTLVDGRVREGGVRLEGTPYRLRLLDYLNAFTDRFLVLETEAGRLLVNRRRIAAVCEQE